MSTATLYELAAELRFAQETLEAMDAPPNVVEDTLEGIRLPFNDKAIAVAMVIRNLESLRDAINEAVRLQEKRAAALELRIKRLREYLADSMMVTGSMRIEGAEMRLRVQQNPPAVLIVKPDELPDAFMTPPKLVPAAPDKAAIKLALQAGAAVPGAVLTTGYRLVIE